MKGIGLGAVGVKLFGGLEVEHLRFTKGWNAWGGSRATW
jgi:hypothetical protein